MSSKTTIKHPELVANRFRVEDVVGRGGMGVVYRVHDTSTGRKLALKQLKVSDETENYREVERLFELEFHTLSHLSHPRVVEVYDYGKDISGPYYTMELLDGGDLNRLSPVPWTEACALLYDVCSALSLLHSRRFIHRDLSTRNIRCTRDKKAKLIDFGAMVPMGVCKNRVGTPQFTAPEAFYGQALDAQTDLFSLGVTAYYALTSRYPYPGATSFAALRDAWRSAVAPPSTHLPRIPKELDHLVMSLCHLDPMARPSSAAEVMERLSAIAGLEVDEQLFVRQAYLSTPTLVGRDQHLLRVRKLMVRAVRRRGGTVVISGAPGVGRSRFLDACVLEAKLAGAVVLRSDAADASAGNWGGVRSMAEQLLDSLPRLSLQTVKPHAPLLKHLLPDLPRRLEAAERQNRTTSTGEGGSAPTSELVGSHPPDEPVRIRPRSSIPPQIPGVPPEMRSQMQEAVIEWLLAVSSYRCVMVVVDDVHRVDEPSSALVALLANRAKKQRVVVAVSVDSDTSASPEPALSLLAKIGMPIRLEPLDREETEKLLRSVFGDVPNAKLLADRLYGISEGKPQAVMLMAQHFLDRGVIRYNAGVWTLPPRIDAVDLPQTLSDTVKARIQTLDDSARKLAQGIALSTTQSMTFNECLFLMEHEDKAQLINDLEQLLTCGVLTTDGVFCTLTQTGYSSALIDQLSAQRARLLHLRLAEMLKQQDNRYIKLPIIRHLLQANEKERALDVLIEYMEEVDESQFEDKSMVEEFLRFVPENWIDTISVLLDVCQRTGRPPKQRFILLQHLTQYAAVTALPQQEQFLELIQKLRCTCGLDLYQGLNACSDDTVRLQQALKLAQERFEATPEAERVLSPIEAITELARTVVRAIGSVANAMDYDFFAAIPSLQPLVPLSPALEVIEKNLTSTRYVMKGDLERSRQGWLNAIERLNHPDRAGMDEVHHTYMRLAIIYAVGRSEAFYGFQSAAEWADALEHNPLFEVNAWRLRMLLALSQCDSERAKEFKKRAELLQLQDAPTQMLEGLHLWSELFGYASLEDLHGVKQIIPSVEKMAATSPGWVPLFHYALGQYQKIRGDYPKALHEFERALSLMTPGRHMVWGFIAGAHLSTLVQMRQFDRTKLLASEALKVAEPIDPILAKTHILKPLTLAQAAMGEFDDAVENAQLMLDTLEQFNVSGVELGSAYETRARIAIYMKDKERFWHYAKQCAKHYRVGKEPALTAKFEKLILEASGAEMGPSRDLITAFERYGQHQQALVQLDQRLKSCDGSQQRAQCMIEMIVQHGKWSGGLLYTMQSNGPSLTAKTGDLMPSAEIDSLVKTYLSAELADSEVVTMTAADLSDNTTAAGCLTAVNGKYLIPLLLSHECSDGFVITGVVVLNVESAQQFEIPYRFLNELSRALRNAGDVVTAYAA